MTKPLPRTCRTGRVILSAEIANAGNKNTTGRARRPFKCPHCPGWHLSEINALLRSVALKKPRQHLLERANKFDRKQQRKEEA